MEKLFLSYTYRSHPQHEMELERLRKSVVRAVEAMGLRVIDGVDVGGRPLDDALRRRIEDSDGLIALAEGKPTFAVLSPDASPAGIPSAVQTVQADAKQLDAQEIVALVRSQMRST
jgi:hypothetical protein